jgi:magnesium-transporting ATPase (P-type)
MVGFTIYDTEYFKTFIISIMILLAILSILPVIILYKRKGIEYMFELNIHRIAHVYLGYYAIYVALCFIAWMISQDTKFTPEAKANILLYCGLGALVMFIALIVYFVRLKPKAK